MAISRATDVRGTALLSLAILSLAALGVAVPGTPVVRLAILTPVSYTIAILGNFSTAIILLSTWHGNRVRTTLVLGLSFAGSAAVLLYASLMVRMLPSEPPILDGPAQSGIWLFVFWHVGAAVGSLIYLFFRRDGSERLASKRFTGVAVAATVVAIVGSFVADGTFVPRLPALIVGTDLSGLARTGVGPVVVMLLALSALLAFRIRCPSTLDRALAFSLLSLALEMTLLFVGGRRFTASYYIGRILLMSGATFVLISSVQTLIDARVRLRSTEQALEELSHEASMRAGRIRALSEIASHVGRPSERDFDILLNTATAAIRPGKMMFGTFSHLHDETVVMDAVSWIAPESEGHQFLDSIFPGATFDLRGTLNELLLAEPGTRAWNELSPHGGHVSAWERLGWRSYIGKTIPIGRQTYFLGFGSLQTMTDQPYAEDDSAYVDFVAALFHTRVTGALTYERLQYQTEHDALTGLRNRDQLRIAIRRELSAGTDFAVALLNLDEFRLINERQGQVFGDEILVKVADALAGVNANDLVARMNGDEFAVILRGANVDNVDEALGRLLEPFHHPFHTTDRDGGRMLNVGASLGCALYPVHGVNAEDLLRCADVALAVAKEQGGGNAVVFDMAMKVVLERRRFEISEIEKAIANDELRLMYQPTLDLRTGHVVGAEALIRWDHPERGQVAPLDFLPMAERNGLIGPISVWVLGRVVRDVSSTGALPPQFRVYFNLSAQNLEDLSFLQALTNAIGGNSRLGGKLGVEITETTAMQNVERSLTTLGIIQSLGIRVAIDDFGTGYSSLSYLKRLPVDVIKIDRSFVSGLPRDEKSAVLVETMIGICKRLNIVSLAEGIETEDQRAWLVAHGCAYGQGYLIDRPLPFDQLLSRLQTNGVST